MLEIFCRLLCVGAAGHHYVAHIAQAVVGAVGNTELAGLDGSSLGEAGLEVGAGGATATREACHMEMVLLMAVAFRGSTVSPPLVLFEQPAITSAPRKRGKSFRITV